MFGAGRYAERYAGLAIHVCDRKVPVGNHVHPDQYFKGPADTLKLRHYDARNPNLIRQEEIDQVGRALSRTARVGNLHTADRDQAELLSHGRRDDATAGACIPKRARLALLGGWIWWARRIKSGQHHNIRDDLACSPAEPRGEGEEVFSLRRTHLLASAAIVTVNASRPGSQGWSMNVPGLNEREAAW